MTRVDTNSILGFREKSLCPLATRLQRRWFALVDNRLPRSQRLYLVTINGQRFERLVLPDAHYAASIAANLREFGADEIYPSLLIERENELWVEYIEGRSIVRADAEMVAKLAGLLALLCGRDPQLLAAERTPFNHALHAELCFLGFWVKSSFLERKKRFIDPGLFERFLREWNSG